MQIKKNLKIIILFLISIFCSIILLVYLKKLNIQKNEHTTNNQIKNKKIYENFITIRDKQKLPICSNTTEKCLLNEINKAMKKKDIAKVWFITQENLLPFYGDNAGIPENYNKIKYTKPLNTVVSNDDLEKEYLEYLKKLKNSFNENGEFKDVATVSLFRNYAKHSINLINYIKADVKNKKEVIQFLTKIADNLISLQSTTGVFGTPDLRNYSKEELQKYEQITNSPLNKIKGFQLKQSRTKNCIKKDCFEIINNNSWQIQHNGGALQFDNGLMLAFLSMLYKETSNNFSDWNFAPNRDNYLKAAIKSANWIEKQDCVYNFNYNSFSAYGLTYLYEATKNKRYLNLAIEKMKLGVFPGTIPDNYFKDWRDGRFMDSHNAKNTYHWIMVRAGIALLASIPKTHPDYKFIKYYTELIFQAGINEIEKLGVSKTSPANEIAFYCLHFGCNENIKNLLDSMIYLNFQNKKDPLGIYYFYKKETEIK